MNKKKFILLGYFLSLLFIFVGSANAVTGFGVSVSGDEVTLSASYVASFSYSVQGSNTKYTICSGLSDNSSTAKCKISVKNGTYKFYANSRLAADGDPSDSTDFRTITTSCTEQSKLDKKDSGTVERCIIIDSSGKWKFASDAPVASCSDGYKLTLGVKSNGCDGIRVSAGYYRYCKAVYSYKCEKITTQTQPDPNPNPNPGGGGTTPSVPAATLSSLSVDGYSLSPGFSSGTKSYTVSVGADVSSARINASVSGGSFVNGYAPRSVNLNYGNTVAYIKVKNSAGSVNTYKITFKRPDNRSKDNTLANLTVDKGTLTPAFSAGTTFYKVELDKDVTQVGIGAVLSDANSKFVDNYGPRTVNLNPGVNSVSIKVRSQAGTLNVYTINVIRGSEDTQTCDLTEDQMPLLKEIFLGEEEEEIDEEEEEEKEDDEEEVIKIPQIENFDKNTFQYTGIEIPYEIEDLVVNAYVLNEGDTVEVTGNENLEVNVPTNVVIKVTSKACPTTVVEYNLEVTRQPEGELSSNASVKDIEIDGHEIDFEPNVKEYKISVSKKETDLDIEVETEDKDAKVEIEKPARFGKGAKYVITVTSPDETQSVEYIIRIAEVKSGASSILLIILAIIVILVIIYIVLRLMGYRIYFNPAMLTAMFRGNGKDKFDK